MSVFVGLRHGQSEHLIYVDFTFVSYLQSVCLGAGRRFQGLPDDSEKPKFWVWETGGSLRGFSWKKYQNRWVFVVAPGLGLSGKALACALDVHMQWGRATVVTGTGVGWFSGHSGGFRGRGAGRDP